MSRRAKIVCTLGPATGSQEQVTALVESGMDVARLNFSHGAHTDHEKNYRMVREASDRTGHAVAVLADLQGPKIRLGTFADGPVHWQTGSRVCITVEGGEVSNNKGLSLPGVAVSVPAMSDKDEEDLRFALHMGVDFVALSFVRSPRDVELVRDVMRQEDVSVPVIAKLEKRAVQAARERNKPVIVATQMLESMITNSRPTRAEASDVANAVLDGADAVMLSGETSVGRYPIAAVRTMERIIDAVESDPVRVPELVRRSRSRSGAIVRAARDIAESLDVKGLATFTQTGGSARRLAALHPRMPLLAFTVDGRVRSQLAPSWGVETFLVPEVQHTDDMVRQVDFSLLSIGRLKEGDRVVVVAGSPPRTKGSTNMIRVHEVGTDS